MDNKMIWILSTRAIEAHERAITRQYFFSSEEGARDFYLENKGKLISVVNTSRTRERFIADLASVELDTQEQGETYRVDNVKIN